MATKKFRTIAPIAGSPEDYLDYLQEIVMWCIQEAQGNTRFELNQWLQERFPVSEKTATNIVLTIGRLGLIKVVNPKEYILTEQGRKYAEMDAHNQAFMLANVLLSEGVGFAEVLSEFAQYKGNVHLDEIHEALSHNFNWKSKSPIEGRINWLRAVRCLHAMGNREHRITEMGLTLEEKYHAGSHNRLTTLTKKQRHAEWLCAELEESSVDSQSFKRMEKAVADAFHFLGFDTQLLGGPGETDLIVHANIGPSDYTVTIDAKARQSGQVTTLEIYTLVEHQQAQDAEYMVVVAKSFSGHKIVRQAADKDIGLLTIDVLRELIMMHARAPLNLAHYRVLFEQQGLIEQVPSQIKQAAEEQMHFFGLIRDVFNSIQAIYDKGMRGSITAEGINVALLQQGHDYYVNDEIDKVLDLIADPLLYAASGSAKEGIILQTNVNTWADVLETLAQHLRQKQ